MLLLYVRNFNNQFNYFKIKVIWLLLNNIYKLNMAHLTIEEIIIWTLKWTNVIIMQHLNVIIIIIKFIISSAWRGKHI